MARCVFTTFHYQRDIFRVNVVRNNYLCKGGYSVAGYFDHSLWESTKRQGNEAIRRLINDGLKGVSVTAVLIGSETANRKWVNYEIQRSHELGMGLLGIYIHGIPSVNQRTDYRGANPFAYVMVKEGNSWVSLLGKYPTYDWVAQNGYANYGKWIEAAAQAAGR